MKLAISLMAFLLCPGSVGTVSGQANPHSFFVKHVVFEADHTPSFVWAIANSIIPWEGNSSSDDVACLKTELRKTGIFKRIESRLHRLNESDGYDLILTIEYELTEPAYKLSEINVLGVEGVDDSAFKKLLASEGFMERPLSLKTADYAIFVERLLDLIKKSIPAAPQREWTKSLWVEIRLDRKKELSVTVMPDFKGCDSSEKGQSGTIRQQRSKGKGNCAETSGEYLRSGYPSSVHEFARERDYHLTWPSFDAASRRGRRGCLRSSQLTPLTRRVELQSR